MAVIEANTISLTLFLAALNQDVEMLNQTTIE